MSQAVGMAFEGRDAGGSPISGTEVRGVSQSEEGDLEERKYSI